MGLLTAVAVRNAKPGRHPDGDGLYLHVRPSGSRAWILRVQTDGRRRDIGLGSAGTVSLAEAREQAHAYRKLARSGIDPLAERRRVKIVIPSFAEAATECHGQMQAGWRNVKHAAQWLQTLQTYAFPDLGTVRVDEVDSAMIRDALAPIWTVKPETAKRVHQRIGSVLDYAQSKRWRNADTPTRSVLKGLPRQKQKTKHFPAMPYTEVPAFMKALLSQTQTMGRLALQFTILTAARSGEVRGATWHEIDVARRLWTVPGDRMKAGSDHVVPLTDAALAVLKAVESLGSGDPSRIIFEAPRGGMLSDMTLSKVLRDAGLTVTVHGFRSSFRDWAAEATDVASEIVEKALAHTIPNKVEAAYRRTDFIAKRVGLMQLWANFIRPDENMHDGPKFPLGS